MNEHTPSNDARNPQAEAQEVVGDDFVARVLEPSPPPVVDGPWFADDPVAADDVPADRVVVRPLSGPGLSWSEWLVDHPEHDAWAAPRWLGGYRRLTAPSDAFAETRLALHRVAAYVVSPARRRANTKIGLRWTMGGFGTPFFGSDEQVRVSGVRLVRQQGATVTAEPLTTLARAASLALDGPPDVAWAEGFDVPAVGDPDEPLDIDPASAALVGDWFGFAWSVLEELRGAPEIVDVSRVQVWPEHFDAAFDGTTGPQGRQATYGASPGDAAIPEPYLYLLPADFASLPASDLWNAETFSGAVLRLSDFVSAADQRDAALAFFRERQAALAGAH